MHLHACGVFPFDRMNTRPQVVLKYDINTLKQLAIEHAQANFNGSQIDTTNVTAYYTMEEDFDGVVVEFHATRESGNTQAPE